MSVRAKFIVSEVTEYQGNAGKRVKLYPVTADDIAENQRFHQYTPSGNIEMHVNNPPAADQFKPGMAFYVDFTEVPVKAE